MPRPPLPRGPRAAAAVVVVVVVVALVALSSATAPAAAEEVGCVTTAWRLFGADHRICIEAFDDPEIINVTCHLSQARTGGIAGSFGLAEDPSLFAIACRQIGPIRLPAGLDDEETVFSAGTSPMFKQTRVVRIFDRKRGTLIYLAYSTKLIEGSPMNSISTVPIMPWPEAPAAPAGQ